MYVCIWSGREYGGPFFGKSRTAIWTRTPYSHNEWTGCVHFVNRSNPGTPTQLRRPDFIGLNQQQKQQQMQQQQQQFPNQLDQSQSYYEYTATTPSSTALGPASSGLPPQHPQIPTIQQQQQQLLMQQQRAMMQQHQQQNPGNPGNLLGQLETTSTHYDNISMQMCCVWF